jgi:GNAT superfamily N-acetyltransferase
LKEHCAEEAVVLLELFPVSTQNFARLEPLYQDFCQVAESDYGWPQNAVNFESLKSVLEYGLIKGYIIYDCLADKDIGFVFYAIENYRALEIKVLYLLPDIIVKPVVDDVFNQLIEEFKKTEGWDVVSYALMGSAQQRYTNFITWYGFKPIGQAIVKFHLMDGISVEILQKQQLAPLPPGYRFVSWDAQYRQGVIDVLTEAFAESVDALWDPRFRSREGVSEALAFVHSGNYGLFWPECNTILLNAEDKPVGICLLNVVNPEEANIPLIGLAKSERKHKLGRGLLAQTVHKTIREVVNGKLTIRSISATVATSNIPAIKMYRHTAFQESCWYPHIYQDRSSVLSRKRGQWC